MLPHERNRLLGACTSNLFGIVDEMQKSHDWSDYEILWMLSQIMTDRIDKKRLAEIGALSAVNSAIDKDDHDQTL
jgi:hypothetical protein